MTESSAPPLQPQDHKAVGALYDTRVQSGQLRRQHEDPILENARKFTQQLFKTELFKPAENREVRFVELGSGVGFNTRDILQDDDYLKDTGRPFRFTAIDVSKASLTEYAAEVPKARGNINTTVETIQSTIGEGVKQVTGPIDNIMSTGVYQITPEELKLAFTHLIPKLVEGGSYVFQYMPPQNMTENTGAPYATKGLGEYFSYRYPQPYLQDLLTSMKQQLGVEFDLKFVHGPVVSMRNPQNPQQMMAPHSSEFCVIHRK